jgi:hypothetical protein
VSKRSRRAGSTTTGATTIPSTGSSGGGQAKATSSSVQAGSGSGASTSAAGSAQASRRPRPKAAVTTQKPFLERHRSSLIIGGGLAVVLAVVAFVFVGAAQPVYSCSFLSEPASPAPVASGTQPLGQKQDDMGRTHVAVGTPVRYTFCPPASGSHYNAAGQGPIQPRFYSPDDTTVPQNWVHNLEHGGLVVLYNCNMGGCDTADLDQLRALVGSFPASPVCKVPPLQISPVVTRFDTMKAPFAALVWGRVLFQDKLDVNQILAFFDQYADRTNPEQQCNPNPSPSAGESAAPSSASSPAASAAPTTPAASPAPSAT